MSDELMSRSSPLALKAVSAKEIEAAVADALSALAGVKLSVVVDSIGFEPHRPVALSVRVYGVSDKGLSVDPLDDAPF